MAYQRNVYHTVLRWPEGWGAVRDDGAMLLIVWQDRCGTHGVYSKRTSAAQKLAVISKLPAFDIKGS